MSKAQKRLLALIRAGKRTFSTLSGGEWVTWRWLYQHGYTSRSGNHIYETTPNQNP